MAKKRKRTILEDPRYLDFAASYMNDPYAFVVDVCGMEPSWQQADVIFALKPIGAAVSVASGHGTGKSHLTAALCLHFLICHPISLVMLTANSIDQVINVVFAYIKRVWADICKRHRWLEQYFLVTAKSFYARGFKGVWQIFGKTCAKGNEDGLAGNHRADYLVVVDEASGADDKVFSTLSGALTEDNNKILLLSQFTRPNGHFADSQLRLAKTEANPKGKYTAITLNSEESPFVTMKFIRDKRFEYGGRDSPEYQIRVLGVCPDSLDGMLLSRNVVDAGFKISVRHKEEWGWVITADVASGEERDSSVMSVFKVSGTGFNDRHVEPVKVEVQPKGSNPVDFARRIIAASQEYPNVTVAIDSDGLGLTTAQECERAGLNVQRIHWGVPPHSRAMLRRFPKKKDMACVAIRFALDSGRMSIYQDPKDDTLRSKTITQFTQLPYGFSDRGQWLMMSKQRMRSQGIASPDIFDTYAFAFLANYIPCGSDADNEEAERHLDDALTMLGLSDEPMEAEPPGDLQAIADSEIVECTLEDYPEVRQNLQDWAAKCLDGGDHVRAQIALMEVKRLDDMYRHALA